MSSERPATRRQGQLKMPAAALPHPQHTEQRPHNASRRPRPAPSPPLRLERLVGRRRRDGRQLRRHRFGGGGREGVFGRAGHGLPQERHSGGALAVVLTTREGGRRLPVEAASLGGDRPEL